jgi:transcriptional regulator with XRE-family HTH domain
MMTKNVERDRARQMRQEQGLPIHEIAKEIGVSISSVSLWVRDIVLSPEHEAYLNHSNRRFRAQIAGSRTNTAKFRAMRQQYQEEGRAKAREGDLLHSQGCMLYWAEGSKRRDALEFVNSDPIMMVFFIRFLRESIQIPEEKLTFRVNCYLDNNLTLDNIIDYWVTLLNLSSPRLRKSNVHNQPVSSQQKGRKLPYGVGQLSVNGVRYIQHIYGAIQEYSGMNKPEWLD